MLTLKSTALFLLAILALVAWSTDNAEAEITREISYQGVLRTDDGTLVADGSHQLKFSIYMAPTATSAAWYETKFVTTVNGIFNTHLGDSTPLTMDFANDTWLQVDIANGAFYVPLGGRTLLTPSPTALFALKVPGSSITSTELATGAVTNTKLGPASVTSDKIASGAVVGSLNSLTGAVNLVGGTNVTVTPSGNNLIFDAVGGATGDDGDWAISGSNLTHNTAGIVALGTATPTPTIGGHALLSVQASLYPGLALDAVSPSFGRWLIYQNGTSSDMVFSRATTTGLGSAKMILDDDGQLGVMKTPEATLDVKGGNYMLAGSTSTGDFQIGLNGNALQFGVDVDGTNGGRSKIRAVGTGPFLNLGVGDYDILSIQEDYLNFWVGGSKKASFWGGDGDDLGGQLFMYGTSTVKTIELDGHSGGGGLIGVFTNSGSPSASMYSTTSGGIIRCRDAAGNITVEIDGQYADGNGRVTTEVLEITGGSDLSEQFTISPADHAKLLEPGFVVSIDPSNPGELQVSQTAYDRKVAGVISGAGGVRPGMLMGQKGSVADGDQPVALTGRVYVQADASTGPIVPGDLLTTSGNPGHAMRVADHARANGAIIGKAMTGLDAGQGLVLVLVSLQ